YRRGPGARGGGAFRSREGACAVNAGMPEFVVRKTADALSRHGKRLRGARILLLGMAYKRDSDDTRESPGLRLRMLFLEAGATVGYNDPHLPLLPAPPCTSTPPATSKPLTAEFLRSQDCVVIVTDHSAYDWTWIVENAALVVDTRNATRHVMSRRERIVRA